MQWTRRTLKLIYELFSLLTGHETEDQDDEDRQEAPGGDPRQHLLASLRGQHVLDGREEEEHIWQ